MRSAGVQILADLILSETTYVLESNDRSFGVLLSRSVICARRVTHRNTTEASC